jgi:hypothetical protein
MPPIIKIAVIDAKNFFFIVFILKINNNQIKLTVLKNSMSSVNMICVLIIFHILL